MENQLNIETSGMLRCIIDVSMFFFVGTLGVGL